MELRQMKALGARLLTGAALIMAGPAPAAVLVFGPDSCGGPATCSNFTPISQSFGDTADLNLGYRGAAGPGDTATVATRPLRFSDGGVNGGDGAYLLASSSFPNLVAEIRFDLLSAGSLTLTSVDFGSHLGSPATLSYYLFDTSWAPLASGSVQIGSGPLTTLALGIVSSSGLILQFGSASAGGAIQNIVYDFVAQGDPPPPPPPPPPAVPEPASWAMLVTGFGLIGAARRRRRPRAFA